MTFLALDGQFRVLFDSLNSHNVGLQFGRHSHCPVQGLSDLNLIRLPLPPKTRLPYIQSVRNGQPHKASRETAIVAHDRSKESGEENYQIADELKTYRKPSKFVCCLNDAFPEAFLTYSPLNLDSKSTDFHQPDSVTLG